MKRYALDDLRIWKEAPNRKPLILRGARQVGKTELVRIFARECFESFIEINFDEHPSKSTFFEEEDIRIVCKYIEIDAGIKLVPGKTLLFLDEIQSVPQVLARLRYFYERMPELHVICAGSLLDFTLADHEIAMPVGRMEFMFLGPMTFGEFLHAREQVSIEEYLAGYHIGQDIPLALHKKILGLLREYLLIGGMPGVVKRYIESGLDFESAAREQQGILQTFYADFGKYKRRINVPFIQDLFRKVPLNIGKTIKFSSLNPDVRSVVVREGLEHLEKARIIYRVFHADANGIPLGAELNHNYFKLLFLDVGLVSSLLGLRLTDLRPDTDYTLVHSGLIAEQFVGQHVLYSPKRWMEPALYYWNRPIRGSSSEVDYLIQCGTRVVPVEVKAGKTGRLKSLQMFVLEKRPPLALRFNSDAPSVIHTTTSVAGRDPQGFSLLSLPLYLAEQTQRLLDEYFEG
uniref:ATP-binding protein n=1 Tax=Gracilinema caldarium TaxID=215591 RepID=A0A7C3IKF8_9SPIR